LYKYTHRPWDVLYASNAYNEKARYTPLKKYNMPSEDDDVKSSQTGSTFK
jgi:hypothetical protein